MKGNFELNNMKMEGSLKRQTLKTFARVPLLHADEGQEVVVEGEVIWVNPPKAEVKALTARVRTETATIEVRIFHAASLHRQYLVRGAEVRLLGKLTRWRGRRQLVNPRILLLPKHSARNKDNPEVSP